MAETTGCCESSSVLLDQSKQARLPVSLSKNSSLLLNLKEALDHIGYSPNRNAAEEKRVFLKFCTAEVESRNSRDDGVKLEREQIRNLYLSQSMGLDAASSPKKLGESNRGSQKCSSYFNQTQKNPNDCTIQSGGPCRTTVLSAANAKLSGLNRMPESAGKELRVLSASALCSESLAMDSGRLLGPRSIERAGMGTVSGGQEQRSQEPVKPCECSLRPQCSVGAPCAESSVGRLSSECSVRGLLVSRQRASPQSWVTKAARVAQTREKVIWDVPHLSSAGVSTQVDVLLRPSKDSSICSSSKSQIRTKNPQNKTVDLNAIAECNVTSYQLQTSMCPAQSSVSMSICAEEGMSSRHRLYADLFRTVSLLLW